MLVRLRPRALAGVDDEQEEVDAGRAGDHRAHEALVAGDVDEREPAAVGQVERRVAEVDRDAARLLLGQPVGVLARQRAHEPRLAVVDVPGGADGQRASRLDQAVLDPDGLEARRSRGARATRAPFARDRRRARASAGRATWPRPARFPAGAPFRVMRTRACGGAAVARSSAGSPSLRRRPSRGGSSTAHRRRLSARFRRSSRRRTRCRSPSAASSRTVSGRSKTIRAGPDGAARRSTQQRAVAAADVDDRLAVVPLELGERSARRSPPLHRPVEDRALLGCVGEPRPEVGPERARERHRRRVASSRPATAGSQTPPNRCANSRQPSPPAAAPTPACCANDARLVLLEDAVARERAQQAVERVGIGVRPRARALRRPRPVSERLGDTEIGDDPERLRRHRPAQEVPERLLPWRGSSRGRAATAAATSSTSASDSVRQSSSSRPSRTTPTTGGSPSRSGAASSSSTAQAKLGSSASGSAPPPTRATVSSTSPPTSCGEPLGPRAHGLGGLVEHAQHRNLAPRPVGIEVRARASPRARRA